MFNLFIIYFAFTFGARVKAISTVRHVLAWESGNHHVASWDAVADEVNSGCILEIFTSFHHPGNCCTAGFSFFLRATYCFEEQQESWKTCNHGFVQIQLDTK